MTKQPSLSETEAEAEAPFETERLITKDIKRTSYTEDSGLDDPKNDTEVGSHHYLESLEADEDNPFADPEVAERYAAIYEKAQYECRHVFDPTLTWTPLEEKRLVRKLDWHVCLWAVR